MSIFRGACFGARKCFTHIQRQFHQTRKESSLLWNYPSGLCDLPISRQGIRASCSCSFHPIRRQAGPETSRLVDHLVFELRHILYQLRYGIHGLIQDTDDWVGLQIAIIPHLLRSRLSLLDSTSTAPKVAKTRSLPSPCI